METKDLNNKKAVLTFDGKRYIMEDLSDEIKEIIKSLQIADAQLKMHEDTLKVLAIGRQSLAMQLNAKLKNVKQEQILLGNGSDEVLDLLFRAFCEPGIDKVITLPPTYGMYKVLAQINNIENREVLLTEEFQLDVKSILKSADKQTKLLFICSPNNPTGNAFDAREIKAILANLLVKSSSAP